MEAEVESDGHPSVRSHSVEGSNPRARSVATLSGLQGVFVVPPQNIKAGESPRPRMEEEPGDVAGGA